MPNPFDDFDSPGAVVSTAPVPKTNPFDSFDAQKNPFDSFDDPRISAQDLARQDHSAIFQHAAQHPEDFETAYQADQLRRARPWTAKAGEMITSIPGAAVNAVKGVANFALGIPQVAANTAQSAYRGLTGDVRGKTNQAEATLAAQHGEQSLTNAANAITNLRPQYVAGLGGEEPGTMAEDTPEERAANEDARQRAIFAQRVQQARNEIQLSQGQPLDTGVIAGIYHAGGQQPSEEVGPAALKGYGVAQADPGTVNRMAAASDPTMLALSAAPGMPGAATIGGGVTELAGNAINATGRAISATTRALNPLRSLRHLINPTYIVTDAAKEGGARGLQAIGDALAQQGKELRTGTPSPLTTAAATAEATGERAIGTNLQRRLGDFAAKGAATAAGMAPLNAALAQGDPEAFTESEAGAGAFGGTFGALARNRPMLVEAIRPHLQSEGARALAEAGEGNDPLAIKSAAYVMSLPEEARNRTLEAIGALQGLPTNTPNGPTRAKLYVLNDSDYRNVIADKIGMEQAAMGGGRGFFIGDDGAAYVNGDYHSGLDPSELAHTIGHEFGGHAAVNVMQAAGAKGGALYQGLINAAKEALMPGWRVSPEFYRFVKEYNQRFDPTGQTERLSFTDPESIDEFLAEQAGQLMSAKGAVELAIPRNIQDRISDGIGRFMGGMLGIDTRKVGTPTHFGREEVGQLSKAVQDTLGQVVGMKLRGGAEIPEPVKTTATRIAELNDILSKPRPAAGSPLETTRAWIAEQKSARKELSELRPAATPTTPAAGPAPFAPSAPSIISPPEVTADAIKALGVMGIKGPKANALIRMANAQHGAPITDAGQLAAGAFRIHGGGAVKPGEFVPKPQAPVSPVPIPTGDNGTFRDELGNVHTVTGAAPGAPRIGDIVATRDGEIRRITRLAGDTVDTARPIDPLNARGTKTHKLTDIQPLAHDYTQTPPAAPGSTPKAAKPALTVQPKGDRFVIVDAAGNPINKTTYGSERDAQQGIRQQGKGKFNLAPNPTDAPDIIDTIQDRLPGIYFGGMSKEEAASFIGDKYLRDRLATNNPDYGPDEVLRNIQPTPEEPIDHRVSSIAELGQRIEEAYRQRKSLADQQETEAKRIAAENKNAPAAPNEPTEPAPTPDENGTLPTVGTGISERSGKNLAPPEPVEVQAPDLDRIAAQAREEFLADKALAKAGKNKGKHTVENQKAADKAAFDAAAAAHGETVPENYQGLRQRTDAFGQKTVSGTVDPSRPFDAWLIRQAKESGHLTDESLKTLLALQDSIGKAVSYDYGHAPVSDEGDMPTKEGRATQQAEHSVAKRLSGESPTQTERKTSVPLRVGYNSGTKSFSVYGVSQEKLFNNFNHLSEKMGELGISNPFRDINDPRFVAALKAITRNQEHGWTGDGKMPSVGTEEFPNRPDFDWKTNPERTIVPDDQFQFVNAILADEGAKPPKRGDATVSKAKAHLANENQRLINEQGETNPLRQQINDASEPVGDKTWTKATLEDPLNENISPALASNIGEPSQSDKSIRVHGKVGDISRFFDKGRTPNRAKTAAGFLPDTGTPKTAQERAKERIAMRNEPSFMPDEAKDREYLDAANSGDTKKAQKMVDDAAKSAGFKTNLLHGGQPGTTSFKPPIFLTDSPTYAGMFNGGKANREGQSIYSVALKENNARSLVKFGVDPISSTQYADSIGASQRLRDFLTTRKEKVPAWKWTRFIQKSDPHLFDGNSPIIQSDQPDGYQQTYRTYVVFDPSDIKLTDAIVRDDKGRIIPPSERFGKTADIRFMPDDSKPAPEGAPAPEGQQPSGSPRNLTSTEGTSGTVTPDQRKENLMEEAESAGLQPSLELMKGVIRGDTASMDKLRRQILERTGRPAKWMPSATRPNAKEAAKARIAARSVVPAQDDRKRVLQER